LAAEVNEFAETPPTVPATGSARPAGSNRSGRCSAWPANSPTPSCWAANASAIAAEFGVPQIVIGFTLDALGTSLPELVTAIQAQRPGETDLVVGNLFGQRA
jgi:cation:H+ antiporter